MTEFQPSILKAGCGTCRPCKYQEKRAYEKANPDKVNALAARTRERNRERINARQNAKYAADPERAKGNNLKRYGISIDDYWAMLERQGGGCAICGKAQNDDGRALYVDHCHGVGTVRGLLCHRCNSAIGAFGDCAERLQKALEFLGATNGNR
ncbi:endonuclease VII domain-containing protein [Pseudomonas fluorescens]|uniref:endonuclease VII domain-containing protein n=1 Tax=Pseudomonas fluorescens TaxID=294 RepID=UPI00177FC0D1|nr:endonuclease VII domain-containing protein [Pseudomonas fluorescens]